MVGLVDGKEGWWAVTNIGITLAEVSGHLV